MSFNTPIIRNASLLVAALFTTSTLVTATTAHAGRGDIYSVQLAQPAAEDVVITRSIGWRCDDTRCVAPDSGSSDRNVCIWIAREMGEVTAFQSGDRSFTADEIEACNTRG